MKPLAAAFAVLLAVAHAGGGDEQYARPLSLFRDADPPVVGYTLFGLLAAVGAWYAVTLARCRLPAHTATTGAAVVLLAAVAATPSFGADHFVYSMLLLGLLFLYFAVLLFSAKSFWLFAHLAVPTALVMATKVHSYGAWQKGIIVYFVAAVAVHHHLLTRQGRRAGPRRRRERVTVRIDAMRGRRV